MMDVKKSSKYDLLVVTGPTASGKTSLAAALALKLERGNNQRRFPSDLQADESGNR